MRVLDQELLDVLGRFRGIRDREWGRMIKWTWHKLGLEL